MHSTRVAASVACLLLLTTPQALAKKGKLKDGVFTSPLGNFTVVAPRLGFGTQITQHFDDHGGSVSFHSDFGDVHMILSDEMSPEVATKISDPSLTSEALRLYFEQYIVPQVLRKGAPRTEVVHSESLTVADKPAHFAVVKMPEGSVLEDLRTHKRLDDTRGLLIVEDGKYLYTLGVGTGPGLLDGDKPPPSIDEQATALRKQVREFYGTVAFAKP